MTTLEEIHPYNDRYPVPIETQCLIVGTAPPPRFCNGAINNWGDLDFDFFYGSETNLMWPIMEDISERRIGRRLFENEFSSEQCAEIAQQFLQNHYLWMRDVLRSYRRRPGKETSAADNHIVPPPDAKFASFCTVFDSTGITKIAFTSEKAAVWALSAFEEQGLTENLHEIKEAYERWRRIDNHLQSEELLQTKYTSPFAKANIGNSACSMFILPAPVRRRPPSREQKGKIYERILFEN